METAVGTVNEEVWSAFSNGSISITFYANDTRGNVNVKELAVKKDGYAPVVTVLSPVNLTNIGSEPPILEVSIIDHNLESAWYTLDDGLMNYTLETNDTVDINAWIELWGVLNDGGAITIHIYARDVAGNLGSATIVLYKQAKSTQANSVPGYIMFFFLYVLLFSLIGAVLFARRRSSLDFHYFFL
ncbi:MAG: hypothetical protein JW891_14520 [Candidatus Lokiarchaeota archaeon]|nr:hypothetical protein [Candidatus Lokiarchaeota archaeon]